MRGLAGPTTRAVGPWVYREIGGRIRPDILRREHARTLGPSGYREIGDLVSPGVRKQHNDEILFYGLKKPKVEVTMTELFKFGQSQTPEMLVLAGQFLHEEIPVRIAHRVRELKKLPLGLADIPSVRMVRQIYEDSFALIRSTPKPTEKVSSYKLNEVMSRILEGPQRDVQKHMAHGLRELCTGCEKARHHDFGLVLDSFYSSRIGIRLLMGQYNALCAEQAQGYVGVIKTECSVKEETVDAVEAAAEVCRAHYGASPPVTLEGAQALTMTYVPAHIYYIIFELTKNSMRATAEQGHGKADMPPVVIAFSEGKHNVCIRISDQGGGIMRENIPRIWDYTFSTATLRSVDDAPHNIEPMAGFGHGLPFSRLYAQHFGGSLEVLSMDGHGTDVYIYLNKINPSASKA